MDNDERLRIVATAALPLIEDGMRVGLGSGSTAEAFVVALGDRVRETGLRVECVATSSRTTMLAAKSGLELLDIEDIDQLDIGVDGADEIDPHLDLVKGRGGALLWEKLVARLCQRYVIIATSEKLVEQLGTRMPLPVEIVPLGWRETASRIASGGCEPVLRTTDADGAPFVTDGGHFILDCRTGPILDPASFGLWLKSITGVVDHGLFTDFADDAITVDLDGAITHRRKS